MELSAHLHTITPSSEGESKGVESYAHLHTITPSLEGESKGVVLYATPRFHMTATPRFYMTATRFHMTTTPRFHRPPPVEGVISLCPLFRGGLHTLTPSLEGESKGVVLYAQTPVSHDRHPPVSPSPSGGGGY